MLFVDVIPDGSPWSTRGKLARMTTSSLNEAIPIPTRKLNFALPDKQCLGVGIAISRRNRSHKIALL